MGVSVSQEVNSDDAWTPNLLPPDTEQLRASIDAELSTEERWREYVSPGSSRVTLRAFMAARKLYRRLRLSPPWQSTLREDDPGSRMLRRLVNIELAHISLMSAAVESGSEWSLIVEDDAFTPDVSAFAGALSAFIAERGDEAQPRYVNVSESFSRDRLRVAGHLTRIGRWGGIESTVDVLGADRPVTNTVCAILYRTAFLREVLAEFESIPLSPVLPIDWKMNEAIMRMHAAGRLGPGDCWFLNPAPLLQRSMHQS
jgi:hypothetical protein